MQHDNKNNSALTPLVGCHDQLASKCCYCCSLSGCAKNVKICRGVESW